MLAGPSCTSCGKARALPRSRSSLLFWLPQPIAADALRGCLRRAGRDGCRAAGHRRRAVTFGRDHSVTSADPGAVPSRGPIATRVPDGRSILTNLAMARGLSSVDVVTPGPRAWLPLVVLLWIVGVACCCCGSSAAGGVFIACTALPGRRPPSAWTGATARIAASLGLSRRVHVVDSPHVDTPTVIGWMKPVILLPIAAFAGLSPSQVEAILAHELAHIRRHDFLVNLLQTFAETLLFYHPGRLVALGAHPQRARALLRPRRACPSAATRSATPRRSSSSRAGEPFTRLWRSRRPAARLIARVRRLLGAPADDRPRRFSAMVIAGVVALVICVAGASQYLVAAQPDAIAHRSAGDCERSGGVVDGLQPRRLDDALHRIQRPRSDSLRLPDSRGTRHRRTAVARRANPADRHQPRCRPARRRDARHRATRRSNHVCI